jgi:P27 family predicted phage terminase small subunit
MKNTPNAPLPISSTSVVGLDDPISKACYDRLAPILHELGMFALSQDLVVTYCEAYSLARRSYAELGEKGVALNGSNGGKYIHPSAGSWKMACSIMDSCAAKLGITPEILAAKLDAEAEEAGKPSLLDFAANG